MKYIIILTLFVISFNSYGQKTIDKKWSGIPLPENYSIVDTVFGDLDKDNLKELVVAYNTGSDKTVDGISRELIIYKFNNSKWTEWKKSRKALYNSQDGGMEGDPFGRIEIKNGILLITQSGGSSWKWSNTDKYRFQNGEFYLIGYSSVNGKICEYWENADFNLSTGMLIIKKEYEECEKSDGEIYKRENETFYKKGIKITLQNRNDKEIKLVSPKYKHEIYISIKMD